MIAKCEIFDYSLYGRSDKMCCPTVVGGGGATQGGNVYGKVRRRISETRKVHLDTYAEKRVLVITII